MSGVDGHHVNSSTMASQAFNSPTGTCASPLRDGSLHPAFGGRHARISVDC
jgi:hypothetical protein